MSRKWKNVSLSALTALSVTACSQQFSDNLNSHVLSRFQGHSGGDPNKSLPASIEHLFAQSPYNGTLPVSAQFPKIAFTVLESPPDHAAFALSTTVEQMERNNQTSCWRISAVVWRSAKDSQRIEPFNVCMPWLIPDAPLRAYTDWWGIKGNLRVDLHNETTGTQRSDGPIPPNTPFPGGPQYIAYFKQTSSQPGPADNTLEDWLWSSVLFHLDFDPTQINDRRVWITKYVPISG